MGAFTAPEVMLMMRPKPRSAMPSTVALMSSMGVSMLASTALSQVSRSQSRKSPGGGPPALLTRMSTCGAAASAAARPSGVVMSPATATTCTAGFNARNSAAVASSASRPRAVMTTFTPSPTSACAQPLPSPLLAAHTSAHLPAMPRSMRETPCQEERTGRRLVQRRLLAALCGGGPQPAGVGPKWPGPGHQTSGRFLASHLPHHGGIVEIAITGLDRRAQQFGVSLGQRQALPRRSRRGQHQVQVLQVLADA